jgi:hypothetical protein
VHLLGISAIQNDMQGTQKEDPSAGCNLPAAPFGTPRNAPTLSEDQESETAASADLFAAPIFAGWTMYGYWHNGVLLNGKHGRAVYAPQVARKSPEATQTAAHAAALVIDALVHSYDIPVFMESHL